MSRSAPGGRSRRLRLAGNRLLVEDRAECFDRGGPFERPPAGQHLVEHAAEGEDVGPRIDALAPHLFRRHVAHGAEQSAGARPAALCGRVIQQRSRCRRLALRDSEVEDLDHAGVRDLDVLRLEIAVHDPLAVRLLQSRGDLPGDGEALVHGQGAGRQELGQGGALDQLHHDGAHAVPLFEAEDRGDVGVLQLGQELRFALEPCPAIRVVSDLCRQNLDRHVPLQLGVGRPVDLPHPAFAQLRGHAILREDSARQVAGHRTFLHPNHGATDAEGKYRPRFQRPVRLPRRCPDTIPDSCLHKQPAATRSSTSSAKAEWASSIGRGTRGSPGRWP